MGLRLWTFRCNSCGHLYDAEPILSAKIPKTIGCRQEGCKGRASWEMAHTNGIHNTVSTLYGRGVDPQFGCVVKSYDHKQQLLKEKGLVEVGGPERLDDIMNDGPQERGEDMSARSPDVGVMEGMDEDEMVKELTEKLHSNPRIDRKNTGQAREQMLESWVSFEE